MTVSGRDDLILPDALSLIELDIVAGPPQMQIELDPQAPTAEIKLVLPGSEGPAGAAILTGTVPPTGTLGNNGDFYLNTAAHILYGPKSTGVPVWPIALSGSGT